MNAADWVVVGLTIALILITGIYAWQTFRLANIAAGEMSDRRLREQAAAARVAAGLLAEMTVIMATVEGIRDRAGESGRVVGPVNKLYADIGLLTRGRVFEGLLANLGALPKDEILHVVEAYGLLDSIVDRAREFLSRPGKSGDVAGSEHTQLVDDLNELHAIIEVVIIPLDRIAQDS
jgi:hypothetical protein